MSASEESISGMPVRVRCPSPPVIAEDSSARIYHYTNSETLQKILTKGTLRFSRMDSFDDGQEGLTFPGVLGRKFFASCWTTDARDTPLLWRMFYTSRDADPTRRLRISIRRKPFAYFRSGVMAADGRTGLLDEGMASPFTFADLHANGYSVSRINMHLESWFGRRVQYVADVEDLYAERIVHGPDGSLTLHQIQDFATHKDIGWAEQSEYRFVIMAGPRINGVGFDEIASMGWAQIRLLSAEADSIRASSYPDVCFIDLPICRDAIGDMEVTLSPLFDEKWLPPLEEAIAQACSNATIVRSEYTGRMTL